MPQQNQVRRRRGGDLDSVLEAARLALAESAAQLEANRKALEDLATQARRARGTREIPLIVLPLSEQIADVLRRRILGTADVAAHLAVPVGRVSAAIRGLVAAQKAHNVGSEIEPRWTYAIGDDASPEELRDLVVRLLTERPFTHHELVVVTGARDNRISGVLAKLRQDPGTRVVNLGTGARGRWLVLPSDLKVARLGR